MGKFIIHKVHILNFRGYIEKSFDLFPNKDEKDSENGIILISGPNGYGKTTLLDSIEWCLSGTVRRLENEYLLRRETSKSLQMGLIKNNFSKKSDSVTVKVEASFNGKSVDLIRTFNDTTEKNAFNIDLTDFKFIIDEKEYKGTTIDDLFTLELGEEVKVSKYFYDRHICTFDKNLKLYNNSREDFYKSFSLFFGGTEEIESILDNLNGTSEKKGKTTISSNGLVEELNNKLISERENVTTLEKALTEDRNNYGELKKNIALTINLDSEIKKYPNELYLSGEKDAEYYFYHQDDIAKKYALIKGQRENYEHLQKVLLAQSIAIHIKPELDRCIANEELSNFRQKIVIPYEKNRESIQLIQRNDLMQSKEKKSSLESEVLKIRQLSEFNNESLIFIEQLQNRYQIDQRIVKLIFQMKEKLSLKNTYLSQIKGFETNDRSTEALRVLVDHITGFDQMRQNRHDKCPLCGSMELFADQQIELAAEARRLLGTVDEARASLANSLKTVEEELQQQLIDAKDIIQTVLADLLTKVDTVVKTYSEMELFILDLKKNSLSIADLTFEKIKEIEETLIERSEKNEAITFDQKLLDNIHYIYSFFPKRTKEKYWDIYEDITLLQRIEIYKEFIELNRTYLEDFLKTNEILYPVSEINNEKVILKLSILRKVENELKNDELLKATEKRIKELEEKYLKINNELNVKERKLIKLKEIQRGLKEIRNEWDKRVIDQVNEPMQRIFKRLSRHTNIESINLLSEGITTQKTNVTVTVDGGKEMYVPNVLSAGQLSMVSLSMFLTVAMGQKQNPFRCYFLDDPIQSMDDLNVLSFVDLLRVEQNDNERFFDQLFITTCNEDLEKLIAHKMKTFGVNLCHLQFNGYGECINL